MGFHISSFCWHHVLRHPDAGVHKLGERLQEISNSASKEFSLEKAMAKMKGEWEHVSDGGDDGDDGSVMVVKVVVTIVVVVTKSKKSKLNNGSWSKCDWELQSFLGQL